MSVTVGVVPGRQFPPRSGNRGGDTLAAPMPARSPNAAGPQPTPRPSAERLRRGAGLLAAVLATALAGCGTEDDLIGTGPVRSIEQGHDGTAYMLRAWRDRTPNAAVLLSVDPATGAASPILPKLPGRRGATIRTIEVAVPRPAPPPPPGSGPDGADGIDETPPVELLISGPDIGLAVIRGPFAYLGAFPVIQPITEQRLLPPAAGPAAARSPDGGHLLLFALDENSPARGAAAWTPTLVDLRSLEVSAAGPARADRVARWTGTRRVQLGAGDGDGDGFEIAADGTVTPTAPAEAATPGDAAGVSLMADPPRLVLDRDDGSPMTIDLAGPADGFTPWTADDGADRPTLLGLLWTGGVVQRVELDPGGTPRLITLPLTFDRQR